GHRQARRNAPRDYQHQWGRSSAALLSWCGSENSGGGADRPTNVLSHYLNRRRLGAYLDGALDDGTARSTAAHLATCGVCQREADGLRRLRALLQQNIAVAEPDWTGFWPGVVRGVDAGRIARP